MSSSLGSFDLKQLWPYLGVVFAGSQKNFGTSGLTFTVVREDLLHERVGVPATLDWHRLSKCQDYFLNTPCLMSIYIAELMCSHMLSKGGIPYY